MLHRLWFENSSAQRFAQKPAVSRAWMAALGYILNAFICTILTASLKWATPLILNIKPTLILLYMLSTCLRLLERCPTCAKPTERYSAQQRSLSNSIALHTTTLHTSDDYQTPPLPRTPAKHLIFFLHLQSETMMSSSLQMGRGWVLTFCGQRVTPAWQTINYPRRQIQTMAVIKHQVRKRSVWVGKRWRMPSYSQHIEGVHNKQWF